MSIPWSVEEISQACFDGYKSLSRVTFGESSSLKLIGRLLLVGSRVREIHMPDGVEGLGWSAFPTA